MTATDRKREVIDLRSTGRPATDWEKFYFAWGRETLKGMAPAFDDRFQKLITLNSVLIGGAAVWVKEDVVPGFWRFAFIALTILSLLVAIIGVYPRGRMTDYCVPDEIRATEIEAIETKARCWKWAAGVLVVAFVFALVGLIVRYNFPTPKA